MSLLQKGSRWEHIIWLAATSDSIVLLFWIGSMCEKTNSRYVIHLSCIQGDIEWHCKCSSVMQSLYGQNFSGLLWVIRIVNRKLPCPNHYYSYSGYGHLTGGFSGVQGLSSQHIIIRWWGDGVSLTALFCYYTMTAEYFRSPFADHNLLKIPDGVSDEKVMFLSDIVCTSYHSVVDVDFKEGQTAAIWGAGPVGLNIAQWLKKVRVDCLCTDSI